MDIKIRITVVVVLGFTVTVLVAVLCILWAVPDLPETSLTVKLCLPLTTDAPADLQCGDMDDIMHNYVQQNIETTHEDLQKQEDKKNKEIEGCQNKKKVKPAASVFGLSEHRGRRTGNLVHWNINSPNSFQRGVHYGRGFLEIKQSGFYYIFSQIKFRSHPRHSVFIPISFNPDISRDYKTDSDDDMTHRHYMLVLSQSSATERILLESYKSTCCISDVRDFTSAIGAVFYLNENDKLLVRTSHPQHLVACNHTNNFGVYMV